MILKFGELTLLTVGLNYHTSMDTKDIAWLAVHKTFVRFSYANITAKSIQIEITVKVSLNYTGGTLSAKPLSAKKTT